MSAAMDEYYRTFGRWLSEEFIPTVTKPRTVQKGVYGEWCRKPEACASKGYCPLDPNCGD